MKTPLGVGAALALSLAAVCAPPLHAGTPPPKTEQEKAFDETIAYFQAAFAPEFESRGGRLTISAAFIVDRPAGIAARDGDTWVISATGGFMTRPRGGTRVLAFELCHEIGHHLAGAPFFLHQEGYEWSSAEGQADYYAASRCMKRYLVDHKDAPEDGGEADAAITRLCRERFAAAGDEEVRLCQGSADAARRFMQVVMQSQNKDADAVGVGTPSAEIVSSTLTDMLPDQCRLDNLLAGALGAGRPACWFKE